MHTGAPQSAVAKITFPPPPTNGGESLFFFIGGVVPACDTHPRVSSIEKILNPPMKVAKRVSDDLPLPPTPTSMALPRGWRSTREMRAMCSTASVKNTARGGTVVGGRDCLSGASRKEAAKVVGRQDECPAIASRQHSFWSKSPAQPSRAPACHAPQTLTRTHHH